MSVLQNYITSVSRKANLLHALGELFPHTISHWGYQFTLEESVIYIFKRDQKKKHWSQVWGFSNSAPGVRMCEELIKTSLSIVEVLSQHHALTSPHHGVVSIPSSVYEAMNYSFIPSLTPSFLPSFSWNLSRPSLTLQESEGLPVTNPLLIPANQISVCLCVPVHIRVCSRQKDGESV